MQLAEPALAEILVKVGQLSAIHAVQSGPMTCKRVEVEHPEAVTVMVAQPGLTPTTKPELRFKTRATLESLEIHH